MEAYRPTLGIVPQDPFVFRGTVASTRPPCSSRRNRSPVKRAFSPPGPGRSFCAVAGRYHPFPRLGPANRVTLVRAMLLALVAALIGEPATRAVAWMAVVGGLIGLAAAAGIGQLAQSILFEMQGSDPMVLTLSIVALGLVALGAGFIPALRASRIDPMNALRYE